MKKIADQWIRAASSRIIAVSVELSRISLIIIIFLLFCLLTIPLLNKLLFCLREPQGALLC